MKDPFHIFMACSLAYLVTAFLMLWIQIRINQAAQDYYQAAKALDQLLIHRCNQLQDQINEIRAGRGF